MPKNIYFTYVAMWYVAHGKFAYVNEISFVYPEHLVHAGVPTLEAACNIMRAVHLKRKSVYILDHKTFNILLTM